MRLELMHKVGNEQDPVETGERVGLYLRRRFEQHQRQEDRATQADDHPRHHEEIADLRHDVHHGRSG